MGSTTAIWPNLEPTWLQLGPNFGPTCPKVGPLARGRYRPKLKPSGPSSAQVRPDLGAGKLAIVRLNFKTFTVKMFKLQFKH